MITLILLHFAVMPESRETKSPGDSAPRLAMEIDDATLGLGGQPQSDPADESPLARELDYRDFKINR